MSASQSAQTDALYKKYQIRTSRGINTPIQNEEESITAIYSSQVARCPVPPNEATYLANKAAYPWIVQKTITYNANPALRVYTDTRVNNIIPFYNSIDAFRVTVGGVPLIQEQFTLDYDTGTLVLYSTPSENPTIKFCQYIGSKYVANQLLADGSDGEIVTVDASGTTRITQNLGTSLLKSPLQSQLNIQNKSTPGQFKLGTYFTTGDRGVSVIQSSNVWDGSDNGTDLLMNPFGGNIGIGKTNPTKALDVSGAIKVTAGASATAEIICANGYSGNNTDGTENIISRIKLGNEDYNASIRTVIPPTVVVGGDSYGDTCRLDLCTPQATNNNTEIPRLSVAPFTGNVGIGTTTPATTLDVLGSVMIRKDLGTNQPANAVDTNSALTILGRTSNVVYNGNHYDMLQTKISSTGITPGRGWEIESLNYDNNLKRVQSSTLTLNPELKGLVSTGGDLSVGGNLYLSGVVTSNTIRFSGTPGDYGMSLIEDRIYDPSGERSELLLMKGNDATLSYGPDRIRLKAPEIQLQSAPTGLSKDEGTKRLIIKEEGVEVDGPLLLTSRLMREFPQNNRTTKHETMCMVINIPNPFVSATSLTLLDTQNYILYTYAYNYLIIPPIAGVGWYEIDFTNDIENSRYGSSLFCVLNQGAPSQDYYSKGWYMRCIQTSGNGGSFVPTTNIGISNNNYSLGFVLGGLTLETYYYVRIKWSSLF